MLIFALAPVAFAGDLTGKVTGVGATDLAVVYVVNVPGAKPVRPAVSSSLAQKNMAFLPGGVVVPVGTTVDFPNQDNVFHNVFSLSAGNEFDLGMYRGGAAKTSTFSTPGEVDVFCNIHPDMVAKILVVQNDFYAFVGADGSYKITGVPAGTYDVVAWSPTLESVTQHLTVAATGSLTANYTMGGRTNDTHLNKDGEQYGRYH